MGRLFYRKNTGLNVANKFIGHQCCITLNIWLQGIFIMQNHYICIQSNKLNAVEDLNQLKLVLVKKKRTNKWLAEQLGVNQTTVSKWCTNTTQPDLATLKRISELLEVSVSEIINFE